MCCEAVVIGEGRWDGVSAIMCFSFRPTFVGFHSLFTGTLEKTEKEMMWACHIECLHVYSL